MFVKVWLYEGGLDTYLSTPVDAQCLFDVNNVSYVMISDASQKDWLREYVGRSEATGAINGARKDKVAYEKGWSENATEAAPDNKRARLM
jgi:hypothetical protein